MRRCRLPTTTLSRPQLTRVEKKYVMPSTGRSFLRTPMSTSNDIRGRRESSSLPLVMSRRPATSYALTMWRRCTAQKITRATLGDSCKPGGANCPQLICPLKFEEGRLFRRLVPNSPGETPTWEEDIRGQAEERWLSIPEVLLNTDCETMLTVSAVVFLGVSDVRHQCRAATEEDLQRSEAEMLREPTGFLLAQQRFYELLAEVMGA